jgi:hypothetical protein
MFGVYKGLEKGANMTSTMRGGHTTCTFSAFFRGVANKCLCYHISIVAGVINGALPSDMVSIALVEQEHSNGKMYLVLGVVILYMGLAMDK